MKKFIICAVSSGILAGVVMLIANLIQMSGIISSEAGLTFVAFIGWTCYSLAGGTPKDAILSWLSFIVGILCAILIFVLSDAFAVTGLDVMYFALPLAVAVGVILMCYAEKLPFGNRVSYIFFGAATFFAMMGIPAIGDLGYFVVAGAELLYIALGLLAGYITTKISLRVEKMNA